MADVRALLKAKRQEAKITHPLASYNANGQLRCLACGTLVKHASAWEGHLGSKAHRTNVARLKNEEQAHEARRRKDEEERQEQVARGKRKAEDQDSESESDEGETKRRKVEEETKPSSVDFPNDFFSDSTRAPPPPQSDDSEDEHDTTKPQPPPTAPQTAIDLEYERFQREMLNGPDHRETYERATVFADAQLAEETHEGMPPQDGDNGPSELAQKIGEDAAKQHKEQEERELIMDRLLDEEMAQEEADMRVSMMKNKMEALRKRREAKTSKVKPHT